MTDKKYTTRDREVQHEDIVEKEKAGSLVIPRSPQTSSVVKILLPLPTPIVDSTISVTSKEESQGMESLSLNLAPLKVSSMQEKASSSNTKKATKIKRLKEKIEEYKGLDRHLKKKMRG